MSSLKSRKRTGAVSRNALCFIALIFPDLSNT